MKVKRIDWLSPEASEAEIVITDGEFDLTCFSQPFKYQLGSILNEPIYSFDVSAIAKSNKNIYKAEKLDDNFAYRLTGKLLDKQKGKVIIGNFIIELDNEVLPGDIEENDFIIFSSSRLDII